MPTDDSQFSTDDAASTDAAPADAGMGDAAASTQDTSSSEKPFDDEPFDAGVEADEETDPKKFIEQLTGKLGQSLRAYNDEQGEPDFELEKFAINSLLSATHTAQMDSEDQKDIIKKVKTSGKGDEESSDETQDGDTEDTSDETQDAGTEDTGSDDTVNTDSTDTEDDSENMFETDMLDEMALGDWKVQILIDMFDNGGDELRSTLSRLVAFTDNIDREEFMDALEDDRIDNNDILAIFLKLEKLGFDIPEDLSISNYSDRKKSELLGSIGSEIHENEFLLKNPKKNNMFQEGSNDILDEYEVYEAVEEGEKKTKKDACYHKVRARYDVWPSAYASGALVKCRKVGAANWGNKSDESVDINELDTLKEKWSKKYKDSIDCNNPKGFSQRAHCQGKKK